MSYIPFDEPHSIAQLMGTYADQFYQYQTSDEPKIDWPILHEKRLVDRDVLARYGTIVNNELIVVARPGNIPESSIVTTLPPLLEMLVWWLNTTIGCRGHGWTACMTPSSSFHEGRRLGIAFVRHNWLAIGFTQRVMTT